MSSASVRSILAQSVLAVLPPTLVGALVEDRDFTEDCGLVVTTTINFHGGGVRFKRDELFRAVRQYFDDTSVKVAVEDTAGSTWELRLASDGREVVLWQPSANTTVAIPVAWAFSPRSQTRLSALNIAAHADHLGDDQYRRWYSLLESRPVEDVEHAQLCRALELTVPGLARSIVASLSNGTADVKTLVPSVPSYFLDLIGAERTVEDLEEYIRVFASQHGMRLLKWDRVEGVKHFLLLSGHQSITSQIKWRDIEQMDRPLLLRWAEHQADWFSKIGIIELILRDEHACTDSVDAAARLLEQVLLDDPYDEASRFASLSTTIVFVGDELERTGVLAHFPPFLRRLASIAQASLIERCALAVGLTPDAFASGVSEMHRGYYFFLRALIDLRYEPRGLPELISGEQLKADFVGRISIAAEANRGHLESSKLGPMLFGDDASSLRSHFNGFRHHYPGPVEGGSTSPHDVPPDVLQNMTAKLSGHPLEPDAFASLVNYALLYRITDEHAHLAAAALRRIRYQLREAGDESRLPLLSHGLAIAAAVTGSEELAIELRVLSRVIRRGRDAMIPATTEFKTLLVAAAAFRSSNTWSVFVADWLFELAIEVSSKSEASRLLDAIRQLMDIEPSLSVGAGRAEAALQAFVE